MFRTLLFQWSNLAAPNKEGLEFALDENRQHFTVSSNACHFVIDANRMHFVIDEED